MYTTKIVFDHRAQAGCGLGRIEVRVTINRKSFYIDTGQRCLAREFRNGRIWEGADGADIKNERIMMVWEKTERVLADMYERGETIDSTKVRHIVSCLGASSSGERVFLAWVQSETAILNIKEGTRAHYVTLHKALEEFGQITEWHDLTTAKIVNFDAWLHQRGCCDCTVWNYHKNLKALLFRAVMYGIIKTNPYTALRGKFKRGVKENVEYLTDEEMKRFCALSLRDQTLMKARDIFVFQMYTGLSYSDAMHFSLDDYKEENGRYVNIGTRVKTGVSFVSELLPPVIEVLRRNDMKVPCLNNSTYNKSLKALGLLAGIATPLHSHLARHTFATWMLRHGAKIENVSRMLGHTNIVQTMHYAKVLAKSVHDDFEKMRSAF